MSKGYLIVVAVLAFILCGAANAKFSLKGDALGESLSAFKVSHPRAKCGNSSDVYVGCQQSDASFAGHQPYSYFLKEGDCAHFCGLVADFYRGQLIFLAYNVSNNDGDRTVLKLLKEKFGEPKSFSSSEALTTAEWEDPKQYLTLEISNPPIVKAPMISVSLRYKESPDKGDI